MAYEDALHGRNLQRGRILKPPELVPLFIVGLCT